MIYAALALTKVMETLGDQVSFRLVKALGKTFNCTVGMETEPSNFRTKGGLVHRAMAEEGLDINELRAGTKVYKRGELVSAEAIAGTLELGRKYLEELWKDDPKIVLPLSNFDSPTMVPVEAEDAPEVPYCMVRPIDQNGCPNPQRWEATELLTEVYRSLPLKERKKSGKEFWDQLQGKAFLPAGARYSWNHKAPQFRLFIQVPVNITPSARDQARPNIGTLRSVSPPLSVG